MRQIVLDTETTGLETSDGHRVIEIGCVELINRRLTGRHFHQYINPQREVDPGAMEVHGITNEFLQDKPLFSAIADEFLEFIRGAELVIHNAPFDIGFLDYELKLEGERRAEELPNIESICSVIDTLIMARRKHPGQRNTLDALCGRYDVDNSSRDLHGALLDSEILADVYLAMTGGQTALMLQSENAQAGEQSNWISGEIVRVDRADLALFVRRASEQEEEAHEAYLDLLDTKSDGAIWRRRES